MKIILTYWVGGRKTLVMDWKQGWSFAWEHYRNNRMLNDVVEFWEGWP